MHRKGGGMALQSSEEGWGDHAFTETIVTVLVRAERRQPDKARKHRAHTQTRPPPPIKSPTMTVSTRAQKRLRDVPTGSPSSHAIGPYEAMVFCEREETDAAGA